MSKTAAVATFFLVANPMTFALTSKLPLIGDFVTDSQGRPTQVGVLLHALVFVLLMQYVARLV